MSCFDCKKMHPKCKAGCCGIVPIPKEIYNSNKDKIIRPPHEIIDIGDCFIPLTADAYCVFLDGDLNCNIYEDRPDICRKFGDESHPMLFCHVLDKNGKERCRQNKRAVERQAEKYMSKLRILQ
jgi:Fe-S-cluster containining protein